MAPFYANLFMGCLEERFLSSQHLKPLMWRRYIDDIFLLWPHDLPSLELFLSDLNSFSHLSFTHTHSLSHVTFLDVDIFLESGKLETAVHIKPTNHQQYLHYSSCHPHSQKRSIPYSLGVRGRRICSDRGFLDKYIGTLRTALLSRGYPSPLLDSQISASLRPSPNHPTRPESSHLFTTYFPGLQILNRFLKDDFPLLSSHPSTSNLLPKPPSVTFQRPPNLRNILVHTNPNCSNPSSPPGTHPCGKPRCKTCTLLNSSPTFTSPSTHISYPIPSTSSCTSSNVVYSLECTLCPSFYIGETSTPLNLRINNHRSSCRTSKDLPVAVHANGHSSSFDSVYSARILRTLPPETPDPVRRNWELAFQLILNSRTPPGLNKR